ncbi:bifunctional methylenetetrahydrofolate dehydrogenase/methenyltetrahydrofolate cyclohydrolase FolD [Blastopirellula sp. JC732]|uniref:Bifunctional protein FolD n=1 Tax=Blastopirellula sediminis TaxID=2894196 RepID=A0A9X1MQT2_9BACT|nr:bifunctional methylenetetrahydrofolate dehydrogenase/methenyltetrahydrofolate cyclohydrolase FolD [Blastopirellula sediminis]MCC9606011.1 bifunctional methylenetetrahydrofolate dehydrogenase/methenyltetrahydrofolate cyclohydrolase FolD [Blastopirellula sediminis]MCC9630690.1 bifunctional methylenetetrahydrofolate dehydrogenase/methenyltetrahydrofolate cyclohydrolase FolD [Blastopirellula sediminis]
MAAAILDGKAIAQQIELEIKERVAAFQAKTGRQPGLAAVLVGEDPASQVYVRNKERACGRMGIASFMHRLPADTTAEGLLALVAQLNADPAVSGILVQLPLPNGIDQTLILDAIDPSKDVDCFHPHNVGLVSQGRPRFLPCTPHGVMQILHRSGISAAGKHAVVIGRSEIVGKPMAMMLMQKDSTCGSSAANATVTVCHSRTADMATICRTADILIAAIGKPKFVTADMVKPGAAVIDVGINRTDDGLCGDVDFDSVKEVASAITPVPGGVGPLTIVMLMENTLRAAEWQAENA